MIYLKHWLKVRNMKHWLKHHPKTIIFSCFLVWLGVIEFQNFTGYCREKGRYLTEDELMEPHRTLNPHSEWSEKYCCKIGEPGLRSDGDIFLSKLLGQFLYELEIYYKRSKPLENDKASPYYQSFLIIDQCARPIDSYGISANKRDLDFFVQGVKKIYISKVE